MFTTMDKALVALVMGVLSVLNIWTGWDLGITPDTIAVLVAAVTPVLVWLTPNKKA